MNQLKQAAAAAITAKINAISDSADLSASDIMGMFEYPPDPKMGDLAFPCFKLAKVMRKAPNMIAEELKNELRDELLEYRDCKILAGKLSEMTDGFNYSVREYPENVSPDMSYKRLHEPSELLSAYSVAAGKKLRRLPPSIDTFKAIVTRKIVSVGSKIESIVTSLKKKRKTRLFDLYRK